MKILVYPVQDYVCASCGYHMLAQRDSELIGQPITKVTVQCGNESCMNFGKRGIIESKEIEVSDE